MQRLIFLAILFLFTSCTKNVQSRELVQSQQKIEITNVAPEFLPLGEHEKVLLEKGNKIVSALEAYRAEKGGLPESLDDLVPQYLSEIPKTGMKRRYLLSFKVDDAAFQYGHHVGNNFSVSVRYGLFDEWYYESWRGLWKWANH